MTYDGGQISKATSTGIAGLKVAICSKLRRLTRNGGAGARCRVASVASLLGSLQFATISARLRQAKFFDYSEQNSNPHTKKPGSVKSILRALYSPATHPDSPLTS
jgi:hypothetical protein